jgi:hypothetical protein
MTLLDDVRALKQRFGVYIEQFQRLLREHHVEGKDWSASLRLAGRDPEFKARWNSLWKEILEQEGGKVGLPLILAIIGVVLGGIGIAGLGGAIGVPLSLLAVPLGLVLGNELDAEGVTKRVYIKIRQLFGGPKSEGLLDDEPDSVDEEFAVLVKLTEETTSRCVVLEQESLTMKAAVATFSEQVTSLNHRLETFQSEIGTLRQRFFYLSCGGLLLGLTLLSRLAWLVLH